MEKWAKGKKIGSGEDTATPGSSSKMGSEVELVQKRLTKEQILKL